MTEKEYQEMKAQITADILRGMEKEKRNRVMVRRVMDEYSPEFEAFDWTEHAPYLNRDIAHKESYKLRTAVGTIARIALWETMVQKIPEEKEPQIRKIISGILNLMQEVRNES